VNTGINQTRIPYCTFLKIVWEVAQ
jgi:hypothetical protein